MDITADRLLVFANERIHAVVIVQTSKVAIAAAGGLEHVRHTLEDVGFHDVELYPSPPSSWRRGRVSPATPDLSWALWLEATASRSASLSRDLTSELTVADAWEAEGDTPAPLVSAYASSPGVPRRLVGFVVVFGVAYPLFIAGVA